MFFIEVIIFSRHGKLKPYIYIPRGCRNGIASNSKTSKSKTSFANKSNLNEGELKGLKSLQAKIARGDLVVCETDKSKRFAVLSPSIQRT